jgi:hypothetical protein
VRLVHVQHLGQLLGVLVHHARVGGAAQHGLDQELEHQRGHGRVEVVRLHLQPHLQLRRRGGRQVRPRRLVLGRDVPVDRPGLCGQASFRARCRGTLLLLLLQEPPEIWSLDRARSLPFEERKALDYCTYRRARRRRPAAPGSGQKAACGKERRKLDQIWWVGNEQPKKAGSVYVR